MQLANRYGLWMFHTGAVQACIVKNSGCMAHIPKKQGRHKSYTYWVPYEVLVYFSG